MKKEEYHEVDAREFVWNHLWRSESHTFVTCPILDMVAVDSSRNVPKWLFTTKDGEVKSKTAKNRNIVGVENGIRCHIDKCEIGFHGFFCSPKGEEWYGVHNFAHLKELLESHASDMVIVPHPHPDNTNAKFMEIKMWREEKNALLEPKMKSYWLSHASAAGKVASKKRNQSTCLPQERLACRNNALNATVKSFALSLLLQLEARANIKISKFRFIVHVSEIPSIAPVLGDSLESSTFRVHFHHAIYLSFENHGMAPSHMRRKSEQFSQSIGEFSTKLSSHGFLTRQASITSSMASSSTYIKPWTFCSGVFCTYAAVAADGSGSSEPSMGLDFEEGDVLVESQRAIHRHRRNADSISGSREHDSNSKSASRKDSKSMLRQDSTSTADLGDNQPSGVAENINSKRKNDDLTGSEARVGTLLPLKSHKILYKNLVLVRDEIRRLEEIDRQYIDEAHDTSEKLDAIYSMREAMKGIWPLPLIRWWFTHGQFYAATQSSKGGIGRLPATVNPEAIVPPSILSKLEKEKSGEAASDSIQNKYSIHAADMLRDDEDNDDKEVDNDDKEEDNGGDEFPSKQERKNSKFRPPKLPKEAPTAMSLALPEAIANPLSSSNPAIPYSNKINANLSDAIYPSRQSLLNNPEDTKWFSLHHQDVTVCDRCYLVYCRLESFRKTKFSKIRELLKQEKRQKLSPEEQRLHDREIERRIFAQKQSTYKLSQAKLRHNDQGELESISHRRFDYRGSGGDSHSTSSMSISGAPKGALPPLPWKLGDDEERDRYLAPASHSVAEKLMRKQPLRSMSAESRLENEEMSLAAQGGSIAEVEAAWDAMMNNAQRKLNNVGKSLPPLPGGMSNSQSTGALTSTSTLRKPTSLTAQQTSLKVAVDQYTAENLLHPWQRDLMRLKESLQDVSALNPIPISQSTGFQSKIPLGSISSKPSNAIAPLGTLHKQSSFGSGKGAGLVKAVSFRLNEEDGGASMSPSKLARQGSSDSINNRPGTSANGGSRGGFEHNSSIYDKDGLRNYNRQSSWSQSIPELKQIETDDEPSSLDRSSKSSAYTSPSKSFKSVGIADEEDDDDIDISGSGLGWNPFVLQQAH